MELIFGVNEVMKKNPIKRNKDIRLNKRVFLSFLTNLKITGRIDGEDKLKLFSLANASDSKV